MNDLALKWWILHRYRDKCAALTTRGQPCGMFARADSRYCHTHRFGSRVRCEVCGTKRRRDGDCAACQRRQRQERRAEGMCTKCGIREADVGYATCTHCRDLSARNKRESRARRSEERVKRTRKRREAGQCNCGEPATPGYVTCETCRTRSAMRVAEWRRRKRA